MVLVVFQVAASQASAATAVMQEPSSGVPTDVGSDDSALMNAANANNLTSAPPFYGDILGGSAECFGGDETHHFVVSDVQAPAEIPQMSRTQNGLVFSTLWGTYYISDSHPESLSLLGSDGAVLVEESYFSLKSPEFRCGTESCLDRPEWRGRSELSTLGIDAGLVGELDTARFKSIISAQQRLTRAS
jgi:hypothetical protein